MSGTVAGDGADGAVVRRDERRGGKRVKTRIERIGEEIKERVPRGRAEGCGGERRFCGSR